MALVVVIYLLSLGFTFRYVNVCYANVCTDYFNSIKTFPSRSLYIFVILRASQNPKANKLC